MAFVAVNNALLAVTLAAKVRSVATKFKASMPAKAWLMAKLPLAVRARLPWLRVMPVKLPTLPMVKSFRSVQAKALLAPVNRTAKVSTALVPEKLAATASIPSPPL